MRNTGLHTLTYLPAIAVVAMVVTSDSSNEAIIGALKVQGLVKVVHITMSLCAVAMVIRNRAISTLKIMDTIFFAVSVQTAPIPQGVV